MSKNEGPIQRLPDPITMTFLDRWSDAKGGFTNFVARNVGRYIERAEDLTHELDHPGKIFRPIARAILSANTRYVTVEEALHVAILAQGNVKFEDFMAVSVHDGLYGTKAIRLNKLWIDLYRDQPFDGYLRGRTESWGMYRTRMESLVDGLGYLKAGYAIGLMYPSRSECACIDTKLQAFLLGNTKYVVLSEAQHDVIEAHLRQIAQTFRVNTFLINWMLWDMIAGTPLNFPGSHKN